MCTSIHVYFSLLCINIFFMYFLPSNLQYTSIISIRTKSGRIHLKKTNFAAIIEKTREFFSRILQCDKLQSSNGLDRARIPNTVPAVTGTTYTEKNNMYILQGFFHFIYFFCSLQLSSLSCTINIKTKNVQTKNILTKHPVSRSDFFYTFVLWVFL